MQNKKHNITEKLWYFRRQHQKTIIDIKSALEAGKLTISSWEALKLSKQEKEENNQKHQWHQSEIRESDKFR